MGKFSFTEYGFAKELEDALDKIVESKTNYKQVVTDVYAGLSKGAKAFTSANSYPYPHCGKPLRHMLKKGPTGYNFWGCTAYPNCKMVCADDAGRPGLKQEPREKKSQELTEFKCKKCGKALNHHKGTNNPGKNYELFGCSSFPDCKTTYQIKAGRPILE